MPWKVAFGEEFDAEYDALPEQVQDALLASAKLLAEFGSQLGRPHVDTLNDSAFSNMKELRFDAADGVWRVAFAFDPGREAVVLVAGDKAGVSEKRFYKTLIAKADKQYRRHLDALATGKKE